MLKKDQIVDSLISNEATKWTEADREFLEGLEEEKLQKMEPVQNEESEEPKKGKKAEKQTAPQNAQQAEPKQMTDEEYLASMPVSFRNQWERMQKNEATQKAKLIAEIKANPKNTFTADYLKTKDVEELQNLANLARVTKPDTTPDVVRFNYGMGDPVQNTETDADVPVLALPVWNKQQKAATA